MVELADVMKFVAVTELAAFTMVLHSLVCLVFLIGKITRGIRNLVADGIRDTWDLNGEPWKKLSDIKEE